MKRLAFYVFWEKDGIVRDYVTYYLKELKKVAEDILVIANGGVNAEGKQRLKEIGIDLFQRENHGIDFGAWKAAFELKGWESIEAYDELILCNCSTYGPVYPFQRIFDEMVDRTCDFWGITKHPAVDVYFISDNSETVVLEHIQSYFMVFKKYVVGSKSFQQWWNNLIPTDNFKEEVAFHEIKFSTYLENNGFLGDVYISLEKCKSLVSKGNASMLCPYKLLVDEKLPLIKRKIFFDDGHHEFIVGLGDQPSEILKYLEGVLKYPISNVWQDLISTQKMSSLKDSIGLNIILSSSLSDYNAIKSKVALVCFVYYPELYDEMIGYLKSMPENSDIYIISSKKETLDKYKKFISKEIVNNIEYRLKDNRGRDLSAYLVSVSDLPSSYDYICYIHDKKLPQVDRAVASNFFRYNILCLLNGKKYVNNIISYFENNPFCGLLVPPTLTFGPFSVMGNGLGVNSSYMHYLYEMFDIKVPFDNTPVAPFGSMFWARTKALKSLFKYKWKYEDFPEESMPVDGTLSHAIERMLPVFVQDAGYYTAWCCSDLYANFYMNNLAFQYRDYSKFLIELFGVNNWFDLRNKIVDFNINFDVNKWFKYKILSKITFGRIRERYKKKYSEYKAIRNLIKNLSRNKQ